MNKLTPNTRALLKIHPRSLIPAEYFILEISPSGACVKLANLYGSHFWKLVSDIEVVELLPKVDHPETI